MSKYLDVVLKESIISACLSSERDKIGIALFVFLVSPDCCVAIPYNGTGLSAVCNCDLS